MRVLIIATFIACAAAAPSAVIEPLVYQTAVVPAAVPTISPGDIQGAASEAQAQINDQVQVITDQAIANANARSQTDDLNNEKNVEAFWSNEDQKWQVVDAVKTAEAEIDGAVASKAAEYAKSAIGAVPYVAAVSPVSPIVSTIPRYTPVVYNSYLPTFNTISIPTVEAKAEKNKEVKEESAVKSALVEKPAEPETKMNAVTDKPDANIVVLANSAVTPYSGVYGYDLSVPAVSNYVAQPVLNYAPIQTVETVPNVFGPTYWRNYW